MKMNMNMIEQNTTIKHSSGAKTIKSNDDRAAPELHGDGKERETNVK